jgi:hypothetical protein
VQAIPRGLLFALGLRLAAMAAVFYGGFRAVSDDDFARVVLAQAFARQPAWDATGSSWLPFPFWVTGGWMRLVGSDLGGARALAAGLGLASVPGVFFAARWYGYGPRAASVSAALAAILPHAVWLGLATVPEGFTAVLCLLALASTYRQDLASRLAGLVCITAAAASRYEAWPVAAVVVALNAWDAKRLRRPAFWGVAALATGAPLLWMAHGAERHGSALFFVTRVANYRHALGETPTHWWDILRNYPVNLLTAEPELGALALLVAGCVFLGVGDTAVTAREHTPPERADWRRLAFGAAALLVFLVVGDLRDGAPTHHATRPLLLIWLVLCVAVGEPLCALWKTQRRVAVGVALLALFIGVGYRALAGRPPNFAQREAEVQVGRQLQARIGAERVLIDTGDYGYLAVAAGLDRPGQFAALNPKDPRQVAGGWDSPAQLRALLRETQCQWLVTRASREALLRPFGQPLERLEGLVWLRVPTP